MFNPALKALAATLAYLNTRDDERGQGTLEYLGAIIVAVVIIGLTVAAVQNTQIGEAIVNQIQKVVDLGG